MKRAAALIAALLLMAQAASASVAIIVPRRTGTAATNNGYDQATFTVKQLLESHGIAYATVNAASTNTDSLRFGSCLLRPGVWQRYTVIIHPGFAVNTQSSTSGYYPDSLTIIGDGTDSGTTGGKWPTSAAVHIFLGNGGVAAAMTNAASCTTGAGASVAASNTRNLSYVAYKTGSPYVFKVLSARIAVATSTRAPGIFRALVGYAATSATAATPPADKDACTFSNNPDSMLAWVRDMSGDTLTIGTSKFAGGKIAFVNWQGNQTASNLANDPRLVEMALAWADSMTSGGVFGTSFKRSDFAIHIDDGWRTGAATSSGGILFTDTTAAKAAMDSLGALAVPMVVGVEVDSLTYRPQEFAWWKRIPSIHYTPHCHGGTETPMSGAGNTSPYRPNDIFGLARTRFALGVPSTRADTSIATLLYGAFATLDSAFGSTKVDRIIMAPGENWAPPANIAATGGGAYPIDSLIIALRAGGATGVRVLMAGIPGTLGSTTSLGMYYNAGLRLRANNSTLNDRGFKLLPCAEYSASGGDYAGTATIGLTSLGVLPAVTKSLYESMWTGSYGSILATPLGAASTGGNYNARARILVIHAGDLCGGSPGYFVVKHAVHSARIINAFANKELVRVVYPDGVEP